MEVQNTLRDYVINDTRTVKDGYVLLDFVHNLLTRRFKELQFNVDMDIDDLRLRIYRHCGSLPEYMELRLGDITLEDGKTQREYNIKNYDTIQVIDHNPNSQAANGAQEDVTQVEKYVIPEDKYNKLENTYRAWKRQMLEKDPNWLPPWVAQAKEKLLQNRKDEITLEQAIRQYPIDSRCECHPGGKRGTIRYVGYIKKPGKPKILDIPDKVWIGVQFDEPVGKHDGMVYNFRYFTAPPRYGAFLSPKLVKVGNYPVRDIFDSDEDVQKEDGSTSNIEDISESIDIMEEF